MLGGQAQVHSSRKLRIPSGQTLLELVAVLGIFMMIVGVVVGSFVSAVSVQRKSLAIEYVLSNTRVTMEVMTRAIRQADPDTMENPPAGFPAPRLKFNHPLKGDTTYYLFGTSINEINGPNDFPITSSSIEVTSLNFQIFGDGVNDREQPRVIIAASVKPASFDGPILNIQTAVSLRTIQE